MIRVILLLAIFLPTPTQAEPTERHRPHHAPTAHAPVSHAPAAHVPAAKPAAPAPVPVAVLPPAPTEPTKGTVTGMPLPRFAALKTDEVNLRSGPGLRYPIQWVYKRRDLPVQIEREFEVWRLVSDLDGERGWVNQATLTGRRTFVVRGSERTVRADPATDASPVAMLKPGVVGRIRACEAISDWCQVQVGEYRGWLQRDAVWGVYVHEAVQ